MDFDNLDFLHLHNSYNSIQPIDHLREPNSIHQISLQFMSDGLIGTFEFFHNSHLIRQIQQNKIYKKFRDLTRE